MKEVESRATARTRDPRPPTEAHLSEFTQKEQSPYHKPQQPDSKSLQVNEGARAVRHFNFSESHSGKAQSWTWNFLAPGPLLFSISVLICPIKSKAGEMTKGVSKVTHLLWWAAAHRMVKADRPERRSYCNKRYSISGSRVPATIARVIIHGPQHVSMNYVELSLLCRKQKPTKWNYSSKVA